MKLTSNHKKILLVSLVFLAIGMFTGNMGLKSPYRETSIETNQEIELLSIRQDLINNKLYYEKDIENRPEDIENYNSRGFYPSFRYNNTYDSYEIWDNMYVSNTDEVEKVIEKAGIKNSDVLKIDKNYETRLPIDNPKILGKENYFSDKADAVLVFTKNKEIVKYIHIDSRIIDFSKFESNEGYRVYQGFTVKLDDNNKIYIDKMEK